jgi:tRNA U34 5-methylaminomethyl-2-thiouridine-forming methyltransferase MnmC
VNINLSSRLTSDGSKTIFSETFQESYHSINGAVTESMHVFLNAGFAECDKNPISIFEVGFGTGLNAYLTYLEADKQKIQVNYHSIELFPLDDSMIRILDYPAFLKADENIFSALHGASWNEAVAISSTFKLMKIKEDLLEVNLTNQYDLIYFDAFSPSQQPALWEESVFLKLYQHLNTGGILTTYCAKGDVRRTLKGIGFVTERLPGPPGKHEMLRAKKG